MLTADAAHSGRHATSGQKRRQHGPIVGVGPDREGQVRRLQVKVRVHFRALDHDAPPPGAGETGCELVASRGTLRVRVPSGRA